MSYHKLSALLSSQKHFLFLPVVIRLITMLTNSFYWYEEATELAVLGSSMQHIVFVLYRPRKLIPFKLICYKLWSLFSLIFVLSRFAIYNHNDSASRCFFHSLSLFFFFTKFNNSFIIITLLFCFQESLITVYNKIIFIS